MSLDRIATTSQICRFPDQMIVLRASCCSSVGMNDREQFMPKMEREGIFEIKEFIDDEGRETGSNEVVDITKELEFFEKLAKAHEMQQKAEASRQQQQPSSSSSATSSSLEPTSASLLASSSSSLPSVQHVRSALYLLSLFSYVDC